MRTAIFAVAGWLVPGAGYIPLRRYGRFAMFFVLVSSAASAGMALHGATLWPRPAELQGLDPLSAILAWGGAFTETLAGGPWLLGLLGAPQTWLAGRLHEYGNTLLLAAGLCNLLALLDAVNLRKAEAR